ncbi:MAG: branched-chain amino acid ABC transporter permease [Synergistaceae bacterium]|nr:branched-chain amino acid ABC transporter permease [Synergistaceae bacterium]
MYLQSLAIFACVNMIAVAGLVLLTGYTGIFSIGHAGFMAVGAYAAVISFKYLAVPFLPAIIAGGFVAVLISVIIGYPALRSMMAGDAFAIVMLGFVSVVRISITNIKPVFNASFGISDIPRLSTMSVVLAFTILSVWFMRNFLKSHYGKNCIAIQQQETAAEMVGINVLKTKLIALMISAFYAGVAGGLFSFFATYLAPTNFSEAKSDDLLAAVVLGGINTLSGPLLAAAILVVLPEFLRFLAIWRLVFYGAAFVVIMQFKPEGLMGYREISFKWVGRLYGKVRGKARD